MTVRLRPALGNLPAYVAGRSVPGAIKLASNELSYPPLPIVLQRLGEIAATINRYPDPAATELVAALAARYAVGVDQVAVGCGSVALAQQLINATVDTGDEVVFAWRSFEAYPILCVIGGATPVPVPLAAADHDLPAMLAAITDRTRLVLLCSPNNPTSTTIGQDELIDFLQRVPSHIPVALDQAYVEFVADPAAADGIALLGRFPNLVVLRTFSKAFGLAGLRVGYCLAADPLLATAIRQTQLPFAVSQLAQQAALVSLQQPAQDQLTERVAEVLAERLRVSGELRAAGFSLPSSQANFVWLAAGSPEQGLIDIAKFAAACDQGGVTVRAFADSGVRVTIGSRAENDRFLQVVTAFPGGRSAGGRSA